MKGSNKNGGLFVSGVRSSSFVCLYCANSTLNATAARRNSSSSFSGLESVVIQDTGIVIRAKYLSISQPANFAHLLILPVSVFPLYAHTCLVKGHFLMLHQQSGILSLTKSGHPTPSHSSNHHLKLIFFSSPTDCVCMGERGREREN